MAEYIGVRSIVSDPALIIMGKHGEEIETEAGDGAFQ